MIGQFVDARDKPGMTTKWLTQHAYALKIVSPSISSTRKITTKT